jgi:hypothetical protein
LGWSDGSKLRASSEAWKLLQRGKDWRQQARIEGRLGSMRRDLARRKVELAAPRPSRRNGMEVIVRVEKGDDLVHRAASVSNLMQ